MKRGVIYARYSCDKQKEESIDGQLMECRQSAKREDIVNEYYVAEMRVKMRRGGTLWLQAHGEVHVGSR